ncbi:hypothetical protein [Bradyrhizobium sp. CCBAU 11434]|uniref:hypothetical protein n=1 Tax=Bradyrhizobium sp. CCBAU 11434 TaxID=1630885 RepID=UPI002305F947|nr:hypothetical protein [Bradyrhizobium sp. CCBAU 11434]
MLMTDRIDKFLNSLSEDELSVCATRLNERLRKGKGRPRGRSENEYHVACRLVAMAVLRAKQEWLDEHPGRRRVLDKGLVERTIENELPKYPVLLRRRDKADDAIRRHVDKRIREFLPRWLRDTD